MDAWSAELRWNTNSTQALVEVTGLSEQAIRPLEGTRWQAEDWQQLFPVYAGGSVSDGTDLPPMVGDYSIASGCIRFQPRFPVEPGITYRAVFRPSRLPQPAVQLPAEMVSTFRVPTPPRESSTVVTRIYPSANVLPENLLKFYVYFSAPMRRGHIYDHIRLLDQSGKPVDLPFLEIDEELWNAEMTRLTLFIDPGRIKRGVQPLEEVGPVLEEGKSYTLVIERGWQDATGVPLRESFRKPFRAGPPQREPIATGEWKVTPPVAGSVDEVWIRFPKPLDHALARRLIRVVDRKGQAVAGETSLGEDERRWSFVPEQAWAAGLYHIAVQTTIEDLAGNNIGKAFEVDLFENVERRVTNLTVSINFEVK